MGGWNRITQPYILVLYDCRMQLQISCNLSFATGRISSCMCRMQLETSCIRQLQNAKFLVVLAPILLCLTLPCLVYFALPCPILSCLILPCLACPTLGHDCPTLGCALNPKPSFNLDCNKIGGIVYVRFFIGFHSWDLMKRNNNNVHGDSSIFLLIMPPSILLVLLLQLGL
jgi:hypothetical protein